jgi:hypothetical protein
MENIRDVHTIGTSSRVGAHLEGPRLVRRIKRDVAMSSGAMSCVRRTAEGQRRKRIKQGGRRSVGASGPWRCPTNEAHRKPTRARLPLTVPKQRPTTHQNTRLLASAHSPAIQTLPFYSFSRGITPPYRQDVYVVPTPLWPCAPGLTIRSFRGSWQYVFSKALRAVNCRHSSLRRTLCREPRLISIPEQFVEYYYKTFDENRAGLQPLYVCDSAPNTGRHVG